MVSRKWTCQLSSGHTLPSGRDASLGHDGVRLPRSDLQTSPTDTRTRRLDGRAQPGAAGADDDDVVLVRLVVVVGH